MASADLDPSITSPIAMPADSPNNKHYHMIVSTLALLARGQIQGDDITPK